MSRQVQVSWTSHAIGWVRSSPGPMSTIRIGRCLEKFCEGSANSRSNKAQSESLSIALDGSNALFLCGSKEFGRDAGMIATVVELTDFCTGQGKSYTSIHSKGNEGWFEENLGPTRGDRPNRSGVMSRTHGYPLRTGSMFLLTLFLSFGLGIAAQELPQQNQPQVAQKSWSGNNRHAPTPRPAQSDLVIENYEHVAASAAQIKEVLIQDAGMMVELKHWVAKEAGETAKW